MPNIKSEVNNFKLMYHCNRIIRKETYLKKFTEFLENIREVVTLDMTKGQIEIKSIEVELKDFIVDHVHKQVLVYLNVRLLLEGDFDTWSQDNPEGTTNLFDFVDEWLNSFNPEIRKRSNKKKES